jgi:chaperonin cofactor prefoldin/DNA-directed RNA polymerase subunit RPC12/RpoP
MFKEKNTKKRIVTQDYAKDNSTLDARHQNMVNHLTLKQLRVKDLEQSKEELQTQLYNIQNHIIELKASDNTESAIYNASWSSNVMLTDQLRQIAHEIVECSSINDELNYYENTGNILFKYYDILEKQEEPENTNVFVPPPTRPVKGRKKQPPPPSMTILDALSMNPQTVSEKQMSEECDLNTNKTALVDEYLALVDCNCIQTLKHDLLGVCPNCNTNLECLQQEGAMVCTDCGYQELLLVEQNRPIMRQPNKDANSHFSYKRINHFREWCSQVQAKQSTDIPDEVFEQILQEIKKEKIYDTKKLTYRKMREILKKLKINRYYEHINYIINRINGVPSPQFSPELEEKLCSMFKEIQGPFLKHCPIGRKNFLSYSFCLNKMVQILGLDEYQHFFNLLKSREKLYVQDQIWKEICNDLGWPVHPSL